MTTMDVTGRLNSEELLQCDSAKGLMNSRHFYALLERFCEGVVRREPNFDEFLNRYFNDEGYVDIWRIPHLMIDAFHRNLKFHKVLECEEFRATFHRFLAELYNFCLLECQASLQVKPDPSSARNTLQHLRIRRQFLNALMATFVDVMENIENYDRAEMKA